MDRKQAYTYGGILVAVFVVLLLLASFLSREEDPSFDGFNTRGYDLADSPFVTDEAEQYLLSSMYPDMQDNGASALYSPAEKEARQEEDAQNEEEEYDAYSPRDDQEEGDSGEEEDEGGSSRSGGGRSYYGGRGGGGSKTEINSMGQATMSHAGGSGISNTWGSPRVDTTPFKQNKMEKDKIQTQTLNKSDARRALSQFAAGSRAAAGLKDGRDMNMKRASMGGDIGAAGAFKEDGTVDLSKVDASRLDTNAPQGGSPDLNSIKDATQKAADKGKDDKNKDEKSFWEKLGEKAMEMGVQLAGNLLNNFVNNAFERWEQNNQMKAIANAQNTHNLQQNPTTEAEFNAIKAESGFNLTWNEYQALKTYGCPDIGNALYATGEITNKGKGKGKGNNVKDTANQNDVVTLGDGKTVTVTYGANGRPNWGNGENGTKNVTFDNGDFKKGGSQIYTSQKANQEVKDTKMTNDVWTMGVTRENNKKDNASSY